VIYVILYTIGFTKKTAKHFFEILKKNNVKKVIDIRLNNKSQLAGFSKGDDLQYFLHEIAGISYVHILMYAPTEDVLKQYQRGEISWIQYQKKYLELLEKRKIIENLDPTSLDRACLLCSEEVPDQCHRRLLAEYIQGNIPDVKIMHL
jgi:uncharacterized protein (DUF488 family)